VPSPDSLNEPGLDDPGVGGEKRHTEYASGRDEDAIGGIQSRVPVRSIIPRAIDGDTPQRSTSGAAVARTSHALVRPEAGVGLLVRWALSGGG